MENIVSELVMKIKKEKKFLDRERVMMVFLMELMTAVVQAAFEQLDTELAEKYKAIGFKVERRVDRTVSFLFGSIHFTRRRMVNEQGKVVHPLDDFLGLKKGSRYSNLVLRNVSELATLMVYRHVSKAIELLTPITMSHQKVRNLTVYTGELIQNQSTSEIRYDQYQEPKQVSVLFIEGDGIQLKGRNKKRYEIHRFQVFEGCETVGKRSKLRNVHFFSSMKRQKALKECLEWVHHHYDLAKTLVISTSDGGSGYEKNVFDELALGCHRHEHFRDPYHVNKKIKERLNFCPQLHNGFFKALSSHEWEQLVPWFDTAESLIESVNKVQHLEQLKLLKGYLKRNWDYLLNFEQRGLTEIEGRVGTCEANHRRYTYRMKRQGRYWSEAGAEAMVRLIDAVRNQELDKWLNEKEQSSKEEQERKKLQQQALRFAFKKGKFIEHIGAQNGKIANYGPSSTPYGKLAKSLR